MEFLLKKNIPQNDTEVLEKARIKELIEFERFCRDNANWQEMKKCFTADSEVKISWFEGTGEEFVNASEKMQGRAPHQIHNTLVWQNNNKAIALVMATIQKRLVIEDVLCEVASDVKLLYKIVKQEGEWAIKGFEGIYEQDTMKTVYPNASLDLNNTLFNIYRSSYACLAFALEQIGYSINNDLPGLDKPELVHQLYEEADQWLAE